MADPEVTQWFDCVQLAQLLSVQPALVRAWVARDLLRPVQRQGRMAWFDFRAVTAARTLARFAQHGWHPARIERGLLVARQWLPELETALTGMLASLERGRFTVRLQDGRLVEPGGQQLFDFASSTESGEGRVLGLRSPRDWFALGLAAEAAGRLEEAARAYERALPDATAEVHFNLGNCYYELGTKEPALAQFEAAVTAAPDYAEAWNNLGIVRGELGETEAAITAYRRALELVPYYADTHYNLADALALVGDLAAARRHWRAYLSYDPNSRWAEQVRRRLQQAEGAAED